jgi:hypothetical protein
MLLNLAQQKKIAALCDMIEQEQMSAHFRDNNKTTTTSVNVGVQRWHQ